MSSDPARAAAVDAFERALFAREALDDVDCVRDHLDDGTLALAVARDLVDRTRVTRLLGSLRRTGASDAELEQLRETFRDLAEQLTAALWPLYAARASAGQVAGDLEVELRDARAELRGTVQPGGGR